MIPILHLSNEADSPRVEGFLKSLRLAPAEVALNQGGRARQAAIVEEILADVARRGDVAGVKRIIACSPLMQHARRG
jgi:hypothetical protein